MTQSNENKMGKSTVAAYEGERNLLLLFAGNENDPDYQRQCELIEGQEDAFAKRDVLVLHLFADGESNLDGTQSATTLPLDLRERYDIAEDQFALLLISKGGSKQMQELKPMPADTILKRIDALT